MDLNLGTIFNTVANVTTKSNEGTSENSSLKDFLATITDYGVQIKSNYQVTYNGFTGLQFFIQSISTPGIKTNNGEIFYKGRNVQVPINYEQEHEFTMTVINDGSGFVYTQLRNILMNDYANRRTRNKYTMKIQAFGDKNSQNGFWVDMKGIRFTNISGLDYGTTDNSIQTFTVNCYASEMNYTYTETKQNSGGILGSINNIGSTITNILGG